MKRVARTHFITGTGTGAGKTILTAVLLDYLRAQSEIVTAIKPICTGPRDDVRLLQGLVLQGLVNYKQSKSNHRRCIVLIMLGTRR